MEIGVDFDGTCVVHEFPKVGKDIGAAPVLRDLVRAGHRLILNTMRSDVEFGGSVTEMPAGEYLTEAMKWFADNGIELYAVHQNPEQHGWTTSPKCYAKLYIDDAALGCPLVHEEGVRPYVDWDRVRTILVESGVLPACAIAADGRHIGIEEVCRRVCLDCQYDGPETGLDSCVNCGHRYEPTEENEDCPECFCIESETHCPKCDSTNLPYFGDYQAMLADGTVKREQPVTSDQMIEYLYTEGKIGDRNTPVPVRLNGKAVGTIKPVDGGWQYFPLNHKKGGEIFPTLQEVQRSLEFEEEESK